tara:strand:- start:179 stop:418 length:240 start_codon:yes stop_codon:yes gene_type:complete
MKFFTLYIPFFIVAFIFTHPDQQGKISSLDLNETMYSAFLKSQSRFFASEKIILSCKFKSMNRKSPKSKLEDKISKRKI